MPGLADIQGMTTSQQIADKYGYSDYADYFNPLNQGLNEQSKEGYWEKNYGAPMQQSATNRFQSNVGSAKRGGRDTLLQNILSKYGAQSKSGFAGSGAINRQSSLGDISARKDYGEQYAGMQDAYGREQFGIGQDVIGKQGQTQSAIDSWYKGILDSLMRLKETDAKKTFPFTGPSSSQEGNAEYNFPPNPTPNQTFTATNGVTYIFDDVEGWKVNQSQSGSGITQPNTIKDPIFSGGGYNDRLGP